MYDHALARLQLGNHSANDTAQRRRFYGWILRRISSDKVLEFVRT